MRAEGVIFDLDGTLVDSIEDISDAANQMLHDHGFPIHDVSNYLSWIGNGAARLIEAALPWEVDRAEVNKLILEFKGNYAENLHNKTRLYDGIDHLLDFLEKSGLKLSVLSNKPDELTRKVVEWYLSGWKFRSVMGQRDGIPRKPDPASALEIAKIMEIEPSGILFVGDSKNDMMTARAGGFISVGVSWGYGREDVLLEAGVEYLIHTPGELIKLLSD